MIKCQYLAVKRAFFGSKSIMRDCSSFASLMIALGFSVFARYISILLAIIFFKFPKNSIVLKRLCKKTIMKHNDSKTQIIIYKKLHVLAIKVIIYLFACLYFPFSKVTNSHGCEGKKAALLQLTRETNSFIRIILKLNHNSNGWKYCS